MSVGKEIARLAAEHGINLRQLSIKAGVPYNTLYAIVKRDSRRVDLDTIQSLADAFGVSLTELVEGADYIPGDNGQVFVTPHKLQEIDALKAAAAKAVADNDPVAKADVRAQAEAQIAEMWDERILAVYRPLSETGKEKAISYCEGIATAECVRSPAGGESDEK